MIWYNENNIELKTDSVTAKDRHVINSSPFIRGYQPNTSSIQNNCNFVTIPGISIDFQSVF